MLEGLNFASPEIDRPNAFAEPSIGALIEPLLDQGSKMRKGNVQGAGES